MYGDFLALLEASVLGQTARASVWLYPLANLLHVLGAALLVGSIAVFDVLILRRRLLEAVGAARVALPIAALGLLLQLASGPVLLSAEATALGRNPVFLAKMALLATGILNLIAYHMRARWGGGVPPSAGAHALLSLSVWIGVLLTGRAIAYY